MAFMLLTMVVGNSKEIRKFLITIMNDIFDLKIQFLNIGELGIQRVSQMLRFEFWLGCQKIPLEHVAHPLRMLFPNERGIFCFF